MKITDSEVDPHFGEASFSPVQLDLPLHVSSSCQDEIRSERRSIEWRSPHTVLTEYLTAIGVTRPYEVAHTLLGEFGSVSELLAGSWWRLHRAVGARLAAAIRASRALMLTALSEPLAARPIVPRSADLLDFLRTQLGSLPTERLIAIYVDSQLRLLRIQRIADGTVGTVDFDISRIIRLGLGVGASGILLVHNHPSGIPKPSRADLSITARLRAIAEQLDMRLIDHLIIARDQVGSIEEYWREARWRGEVD